MQTSLRTYFRLIAEGQEQGRLAKALSPALCLGSALYKAVNGTGRKLYENKILKPKKLPIPVISVGNLTWGGTGKTPLVEWLSRKVNDKGRKPMVLTRGYGADEVNQLRHHLPELLIAEGRDRYQNALTALKSKPADCAIMDDGFQHWPVQRDLEIVVINSLQPFGNRKLLPCGILREPLTVLNRADVVVLSHVNLVKSQELQALREEVRKLAPKAALVETILEPLFFYRSDKKMRIPIIKLKNSRVTTISGVASPQSFRLLLQNCQIKPTRNFEFNDHHAYSENELREVRRVSDSAAVENIITTEKDFYRSPKKIAEILDPLILATRLCIVSGEGLLHDRINKMLEAAAKHA